MANEMSGIDELRSAVNLFNAIVLTHFGFARTRCHVEEGISWILTPAGRAALEGSKT